MMTKHNFIATVGITTTCIFASLFIHDTGVSAQDAGIPVAKAPANHGLLRHTASGAFYVDNNLLKQFKEAEELYESLRTERYQNAETDFDNTDAFSQSETEFLKWESRVEDAKVLVQPFNAYKRRETMSFDMGDSPLVVITADDVNLRGWNGDNIKCVVEKTLLGTKEPDDSQFDAIIVHHELRQADELVGVPDDDRQQQEAKFFASENGKTMTPDSAAFRKRIQQQSREYYAVYEPMQGKAVNLLQLKGLTGQEGNRHLPSRIESPGGGVSMSSNWQRSAKVTIYLPQCQTVAVRGCMLAVDIKSVQADLILTTDGSQDRSYGDQFSVSDIDGDITIRQAPIRRINGVSGNVIINQTKEVTNTSTCHSGGTRTISSPPPGLTSIADVQGSVTGHFVRADLSLGQIGGQINVTNEYGNTRLSITKNLTKTNHRVLSHSGVIRLSGQRVTKESFDADTHDFIGIPLHAFSQSGRVSVKGLRNRLERRMHGSGGRSWQGFQSPSKGFSPMAGERQNAAWDDQARSVGLDLISNAGTILIESAPE